MTVSTLHQLATDIVSRAKVLKDNHTDQSGAPVNYACIFSQSDTEYHELLVAAQAIGTVIKDTPTGPLFQIAPLATSAGKLRLLKIRKPDATRPERGDADFTVDDYPGFKARCLSKPGFSLIERPGMEMIELVESGTNVRAYFSYPPLDQELGLTSDQVIPEIVPSAKPSPGPAMLARVFRYWPLSSFHTNPIYRLPMLVIMKLLGLLALFQLALICGLPWGRAVWGGQDDVLPTSLRIGSAISILIYILMFSVALDRTSENSRRVYRRRTAVLTWAITVYLYLGVVINLISPSLWEKYLMAPIAFVLALSFTRLVRRPKMTEAMVHANS